MVCRARSFFCAMVGGVAAPEAPFPFAKPLVLLRYSGAPIGVLLPLTPLPMGETAPLRQPTGEMLRTVRGLTAPFVVEARGG